MRSSNNELDTMDDRTAGPDWSGPVRGPEFGPKIRSGADNPDRYGFRSGFPS